MPRQFHFPPGCRVLRATVSPQALPFHSKPGFLFAPSVGSKQNKDHNLCASSWGVLFLLGGPAQTAQHSLHPWGFVAGKPNYPKPRETEVLTLTKPQLTCTVGSERPQMRKLLQNHKSSEPLRQPVHLTVGGTKIKTVYSQSRNAARYSGALVCRDTQP